MKTSSKAISIILVILMVILTLPLTTIPSFALAGEDAFGHTDDNDDGICDTCDE